jgi:hypothetical protein
MLKSSKTSRQLVTWLGMSWNGNLLRYVGYITVVFCIAVVFYTINVKFFATGDWVEWGSGGLV